jgi:DNA-binding response OmpR family regulator
MTRVLMIDRDRTLTHTVAMACLDNGVAIRMAETLCEGVRWLLDEPASVVLVDSALMRPPGTDLARLFDMVAPDVPVIVLVEPAVPVEEVVSLQLQGFGVISKPFDVRDILAKLAPSSRALPARAGAASQVEALCR